MTANTNSWVSPRPDRRVSSLWPVNEIVLRSLVLRCVSDAEIAEMYGTTQKAVTELRDHYGLTQACSD